MKKSSIFSWKTDAKVIKRFGTFNSFFYLCQKNNKDYARTKSFFGIMVDIDLIRIVDVDYIKDYTMDLKFSNGETRRVDFLPLLKGNKREELKDMNKFIQFGLTHWTLEWYNGIDFAPDFLYKQGKKVA